MSTRPMPRLLTRWLVSLKRCAIGILTRSGCTAGRGSFRHGGDRGASVARQHEMPFSTNPKPMKDHDSFCQNTDANLFLSAYDLVNAVSTTQLHPGPRGIHPIDRRQT
jgi:hypothetical protein